MAHAAAPPRPEPADGQGEVMRRNHRVAPWLPVIPVILGPSDAGGDTLSGWTVLLELNDIANDSTGSIASAKVVFQ